MHHRTQSHPTQQRCRNEPDAPRCGGCTTRRALGKPSRAVQAVLPCALYAERGRYRDRMAGLRTRLRTRPSSVLAARPSPAYAAGPARHVLLARPRRRPPRPGRGRLDLGPVRGGRRPAARTARSSSSARRGDSTSRPRRADAHQQGPRPRRRPGGAVRAGTGWMSAPVAGTAKRRPSEVRLDRLLEIDADEVRREGAALDRQVFDQVVDGVAQVRTPSRRPRA